MLVLALVLVTVLPAGGALPSWLSNPAGNWLRDARRRLAEKAIGRLLDNQLPLKLDANAIYPTVAEPPGGPFHPLPLELTPQMMNEPLPPGDYTMRALAFCSEYSVHQPGAGTAYEVGPVQGRTAAAIATLLWRGTLEKGVPARDLQAVSWAIQAGVTYAKMPRTFQAVVDEVIPEYRSQLGGDFIQNLEDLYQSDARAAGLPPLDQLLAGMGKPGELALSADRQRQVLLQQNTSDERKEQILFAGQGSRMAPVRAAAGPWTVRIPGEVYERYLVRGGNMATNNEIELRILPPPRPRYGADSRPRVILAAYHFSEEGRLAAAPTPAPAGPAPTLHNIVYGGIGYSMARGAQALYFVPVTAKAAPAPKSKAVGTVKSIVGTVTITRNGVTRPLTGADQIQKGDILTTGSNSRLWFHLADGTRFVLGENCKITVNKFIYDPDHPARSTGIYTWLEGAFNYVGGLIEKKSPNVRINTPVDGIGIRGTDFIARYDARMRTVDIELISGSVEVTPNRSGAARTFTAPVRIHGTASSVTGSPLTREQYEATRAALISP